MNEIEKLYENAGIDKLSVCEYTCMNATNCNVNCVHYNDKTTYYPPFTAEKQIELIKWLIKSGECSFTITIKADEFDEDLAKYINRMWCDLTEEERKQIKDILK